MNTETKKNYNPDWQEVYAEMVAVPDEAVTHVQPGQRVFVDTSK